jgi:hypothetical protein
VPELENAAGTGPRLEATGAIVAVGAVQLPQARRFRSFSLRASQPAQITRVGETAKSIAIQSSCAASTSSAYTHLETNDLRVARALRWCLRTSFSNSSRSVRQWWRWRRRQPVPFAAIVTVRQYSRQSQRRFFARASDADTVLLFQPTPLSLRRFLRPLLGFALLLLPTLPYLRKFKRVTD